MFLSNAERDVLSFRESHIYAFKCMTWKKVLVLEDRCFFVMCFHI